MGRKPYSRESLRYKARIGYEGEYSLLRKFVDTGETGYYAVRTPGSGSGKMAKPDIIAVDHGELMAIEVKSSGRDYAMLSRDQVARLLEFVKRFEVSCPHCGNKFNPKPIAAIRFIGRGWKFVDLGLYDGKNLIVRWDNDGRGS